MTGNQRGFTLIEVIMTIVLLAVLTSGLMAMFTTFSQFNGDPSVMIQASELAQEKMDQTVANKTLNGFNSIAVGNTTDNPVLGTATFTRVLSVGYVNPAALNTIVAGPTNYKNITVTVTSNAGTLTLATLIGSY